MKLYTELDTLLDTKYPIVKNLTGINGSEYMVRKNNNFRYIGATLFDYIFKHREKGVLVRAAPTLAFDLIKESIAFDKVNQQMDGLIKDSTIYINYYPYELDEDEVKDLTAIYSKQLKEIAQVELIKEEPNAKFILSHDSIVVFDGIGLIDRAVKELDLYNKGRPAVTLICAACIDDTSGMEDYEKAVSGLMDQYSPFINMQMVGLNMFSGVFTD